MRTGRARSTGLALVAAGLATAIAVGAKRIRRACNFSGKSVNNAGIIQVGPVDHMQLSDYDDAMKTHFWGPLFLVLAVLPHMRNQGGRRIVNIAPAAAH